MIHLVDLVTATGGRVHGPVVADAFADFCYDSRLLSPGELFVAVVTDKGDGHDYAIEAARAGAAGVLCQRPLDVAPWGATCLVVDDTRAALVDWARYILRKQAPDVVAIAGSSGKTTTKELTAAVLGRGHSVFRNQGNYNNRYGLTIALGRLNEEHRVAVLELAGDAFDEIRDLTAITRPRVGIVTTVNETHVAYLGSIEAIAAENARLVEALPPAAEGGLAILNYDDPRVRTMAARTRARVVTYGLDPNADLVAGAVEAGPDGVTFTVFVKDFYPTPVRHSRRKLAVRLQILGRHAVHAALAAVAAGLAFGVPLEEALAALAEVEPLPGRLNPLPGAGETLIVDDTFDASPASTLAALDTLAFFGRRRVAVLGAPFNHAPRGAPDLDALAGDAYRRIGARTAAVVDMLVAQGDLARHVADEARAAGLPPDRIALTYTTGETLRVLQGRLVPGDTVLVKGAVASRMERVVAGLLARPEQGQDVLVRQTAGWQQVRLLHPGRPTWVEVDLDAVANNARRAVEWIGPNVRLLAVLKADAYGHGATRVARTVLNNGASYLGVASINEAAVLRTAGIAAPILVLGYTPAWQGRELALHDLTATVFDLEVATALGRAARELDRQVRVHVKVDSGMGRLGLLPEEAVPFVLALRDVPGLILEGIFTHFSVADTDAQYTRWQLGRFRQVLERLARAGVRVPLVHAANTAGLLALPEAHFSMVRLGIGLYGLQPSPDVPLPPDFRPALTFKTTVAQVKTLPAGSCVGYGNTYRTEAAQCLAVLPVGYADGFRRAPRHWGEVLVRGRRAPLVGRVSMDQTVVDVTAIPGVRQGDEVVLIGRQGEDEITAEEVAERLGTINYEVVSEILARVPRVV